MIFDGKKAWEIRGSDTKIRGRIGLIESGSGLIIGECNLFGTFPIVKTDHGCVDHHGIKNWHDVVKYDSPHAWVFMRAKRYNKPIPYKHPQGAVIWVNLEGRVWK